MSLCLITFNRQTKTLVVPAKLMPIMSSGHPVIASVPLDGDMPKIVTAAHCGLVVEPESPEMLAEAIFELCDNSSLAEELGKNGREYAEKHFSMDVCATKYEEVLRRVCQQYERRNLHGRTR